MTLPTAYSWSPVGKRLYVPYEAPKGRRVNVIGALFHGREAGEAGEAGEEVARGRRFEFLTRARAPKTKRKPFSILAQGLLASEQGVLNADVLIGFIWKIAGRPDAASADWRREKPLVVVLDNYSVHVGKRVQEERSKWEAADIALFYLPSYSPQLSGIEPVWRDVKQHRMRRLSRESLLVLKRDVDAALTEKANLLLSAQSTN